MLMSAVNFAILAIYFDDDSILSPPQPPAAAGAAPAPPQEPVPMLLVILCCTPVFLIAMSYLGGYESALALIVNQWYGWDSAESAYVFVPMAVEFSLFALFVIPWMLGNWSDARIAIVTNLIQIGMLTGINWADLYGKVPSLVFVASKMFAVAYNISYTHHMTILAKRLPKAHQVKYNSLLQLVSQIGRAIGPVLMSFTFEIGNKNGGLGPVLAYMIMIFVAGAGQWIPLFFFNYMYLPQEASASLA
jgi:hypothetical protein